MSWRSAGRSAALALAVLVAAGGAARAQGWDTRTIFADTLSVGVMRASSVVDMSNYRSAAITIRVNPPAGVTTPWSRIAVRLIGSSEPAFSSGVFDTTTASIMLLQPQADRSYIGSAAGDSLAYGAFYQGNAVQLGAGEIVIYAQVPNTKWPSPHAITFDLNNKGQSVTQRYWRAEIRVLSAGVAQPTRVTMRATRRN